LTFCGFYFIIMENPPRRPFERMLLAMKKTLYISDLDGTLLRGDQTISPYTAQTVGDLIRRGLLFSYATARSYTTASKVAQDLPEKLPVIVFNGSFIIETGTGKRLLSNTFSKEDASKILDRLLKAEVFPVVNAFLGEHEKFSYLQGKESRGVLAFIEARREDLRKNPVSREEALYEGEIFHIACIDEEKRLRPLYEYFKDDFPCVLYRDMYSGEIWLEIHPRGATKASAALALKSMLNCDRIVCFGDGINDIPLFEIADECYAVANAEDNLKALATATIGSNEEDGVAKFLAEHTKSVKF